MLSDSVRVPRGEGEIAQPLAALAAEFSDLSFGSYPFVKDGAYGTNLVVRGTDPARIALAMVGLLKLVPAAAE